MTQNIQKLRDNYERCNIWVMEISDEEEREKGIKEIFKATMAENFPKLMTETKLQFQKAQKTPTRIHAIKTFYIQDKHMIFKLQNIKDKENISSKKLERERKKK